MLPNEPPSAPTPPSTEDPGHKRTDSKKRFLATTSAALSEALTHLPRQRRQGLFWLVVLATSTLTGAVAFQWLTGLPATPNCGKLFKATLSDSGQLYCADQAARKGDEASLSEALRLAGSINQSDPLFEQSRQLADHWSKSILVLARQKVEAGDLKKGVALAQQVPKTSPVHEEAQAMIKDWQSNWAQGDAIFVKAKKAIQDQKWGIATEQVSNLVQIGSQYWQKRADTIVSEISIEQQAFLKIDAAQDLVNQGTPDSIAKAIQEISKIDSKRLARKRVAEKIDEWSQKLIDIAKSAQDQGDYSTVIQAAQKVPPNSKLANQATAYLQIGRAESLENADSPWSSIQAYAYSAQIDPKTAAYEASKARREKWESQVQNWGQLALAQWMAGADQLVGYQVAIDQAKMVGPDQARRVEAQTLIASWNKQIESFPARQFLARAEQIAASNTVESLQRAITEASKALSSNIQQKAQSLIADWSSSVERVQDQPILDQARALARKGDLNAAIQVAEKIGSGRSLYRDARNDIYDWVGRIQAAEDRPILNDAEALASQGRLSAAIARASNISSNRALYSEAQSRIADWADQRRQAEEANQPAPDTLDNRTEPSPPADQGNVPPLPAEAPSAAANPDLAPAPAEPAAPPSPAPEASGSGQGGSGSGPNF